MPTVAQSAVDRKRYELQQKLAAKQLASGAERTIDIDAQPAPEENDDEKLDAIMAQIAIIKDEETRLAEKDKTWDATKKVYTAPPSEDTVKAAPVKLCKEIDLETVGSMSAAEKSKLGAMIGSAKSQQMKAYSNTEGGEYMIGDSECSGATTLAFNGCVDSTFTLTSYCAKVFIQSCENCTFLFDTGSKILTETIEVHRCVDTKLEIKTRVGTLQVDQSDGVKACFEQKDYFGNPSMLRKGREFGNDGRVVWAGCEQLTVQVGSDSVVGDFEAEALKDKTCNLERTQFKGE
jgi:hypothetical protein